MHGNVLGLLAEKGDFSANELQQWIWVCDQDRMEMTGLHWVLLMKMARYKIGLT